jgi:glycosyltransferase involved in cell wall biosynthesis
MPIVSVLLPVRDAGAFLAPSLASLWRQSLHDFEVVAVDDGSTDGSGETLERAARSEPRLRVLRPGRVGLPGALNLALAAARGRWIARHDADDLSHPRRFELQHALLSARPDLTVAGCRLELRPRSFSGLGMRRWVAWHNALLTHEAMAREALVDSPLAHGTAMIGRSALEDVGGWRDKDWPEDLDLWLRLLAAGARFAKLPATLYAWRQHASNATRRDARYRQSAFDALRVDALERWRAQRRDSVTLVGVGASLDRWRALVATPRRVAMLGRPGQHGYRELSPPAILVFGAPRARDRWRSALSHSGWHEGRDFIFVA